MAIQRILAVYFSATGTTKSIVTTIAEALAGHLKLPMEILDFTLPQNRQTPLSFTKEDLVILGTPVIAGRVPNVLLPYLSTIEGGGALSIPVVVFGNRHYDDALVELRDILLDAHTHPIAAGAFIGEHSFSRILGAGRPDDGDLATAVSFAHQAAAYLEAAIPVAVDGTPKPYRGYYKPQDHLGNPINILKVKPKTSDACNGCGLCAHRCPMGSINPGDYTQITGICIKCCACVKACPQAAKYYDDPGYLYHQRELEEMYQRRAQPQLFFPKDAD
ncbi:ferredoxin [Eubacterium sp.]|uniref:ferredoxin n=1 Tax=Eubacterium sp. TaxID=142586 RepID=UPI002FC7FE9D